jgi:hypothetical protein
MICKIKLTHTKLFFMSTEFKKNNEFDNNGRGLGNISPAMVLRWNDAATYVVARTLQLQPTPRIPPFRESHYYAMVNIAVHDAFNNIVPKYKSYALNSSDKDADPDAAVAQAAHDVISFFFGKLNPPANVTPQEVQDYIHNLLNQGLHFQIQDSLFPIRYSIKKPLRKTERLLINMAATYSPALWCSTIGHEGLNFSVRYGKR